MKYFSGDNKKLVKFLVLLLLIPPSFLHKTVPANKRHFIKLRPNHHNGNGAVPINRQKAPFVSHTRPKSPQQGTLVIQELPGHIFSPQNLSKSSFTVNAHPPNRFTIAPPRPSMPIAKKCKGKKNIVDDIAILSLVTAATASAFGLYTVIVNSMTSNNIGIVSGFFSLAIWLPATLITLFNLNGDFIQMVGNFLNGLSFINSMYGFTGVFFGTADVLASTVGETIGIISFILSVMSTFPELLDSMIEYMYKHGNRPRLEYYVENYGCSVPGIFELEGEPLYDVVNRFLVEGFNMKSPFFSQNHNLLQGPVMHKM